MIASAHSLDISICDPLQLFFCLLLLFKKQEVPKATASFPASIPLNKLNPKLFSSRRPLSVTKASRTPWKLKHHLSSIHTQSLLWISPTLPQHTPPINGIITQHKTQTQQLSIITHGAHQDQGINFGPASRLFLHIRHRVDADLR